MSQRSRNHAAWKDTIQAMIENVRQREWATTCKAKLQMSYKLHAIGFI